LTVITTKIRPSKPRVREEYATSFMHIFDTNKVPRVVLQFLWIGTHLGGKWSQCATRARHGRTTRHGRPCRCGRPGKCGRPCWCSRPCQVQPHLPRATSSVPNASFPACTTWMNEIDQGNISLIESMKFWLLGSMGCDTQGFQPGLLTLMIRSTNLTWVKQRST
jgi:hypothetical protein